MSLGETYITLLSQVAAAHRLRNRTFNPRARRVLFLVFRRLRTLSRPLQSLPFDLRQDRQTAPLLFRLRTLLTQWTRAAVHARKLDLNHR